MGCLGVHFALTADEVEKLKSFPDDSGHLDFLQEELEEKYFGEEPDFKAESDKAWDAMHRALTDGKLEYGGADARSLVVLGGEPLYFENDYIIVLKTPEQVREVAGVVTSISKSNMRQGYDNISPKAYGYPKSDEDFEYTWDWFQGVAELFKKAAQENRFVLFTASQ